MKAFIEPRDVERLPFDTRVAIDFATERGAVLSVMSKARCRRELKSAPIGSYRIDDRDTGATERVRRARRRSDKPTFHGLEDWDLFQAFVPVHQPRSSFMDMAAANALFKELYAPEAIERLAFESNPFPFLR